MTTPGEVEAAIENAQMVIDQRDANEQLLLAAIHSHEQAEQAEQGHAQAMVAAQSAVAGRDRAETALRNANRLATIGLLATSIAHELGTPLAVITVRAQTLASGEVPPEEVTAEGAVILQQAQRMTRMVREVLDVARPADPIQTPVDMVALARQAMPLLVPLARKRGIKIELTIDSGPAMVLGDSSRLLQVVTNLILNAKQSMSRAGTVRTRLGRRRTRAPGGVEADYVFVDVQDEGAGIPPEILPRIFETFFTTKSEGTGLGLAVSKRIANEHQGFIAVASEVGRGTCFTLYLPPLPPV